MKQQIITTVLSMRMTSFGVYKFWRNVHGREVISLIFSLHPDIFNWSIRLYVQLGVFL